MLKRSNRFHGYSSLNWAYKNGHVVRDQYISLKYALNARRQVFRVAVVISKKVSKSAVQRNRMRRRIYAQIRRHETNINGSYDLIFTVFKPELAQMSSVELDNIIQNLLIRARII